MVAQPSSGKDEPASLYASMANKYGIKPSSSSPGGELLPPTSRFAKRNSISGES